MSESALVSFIRQHRRLLVLTGAGISVASGILGYRDAEGRWTRAAPVHLNDFLASADVRRRYWLRSMAGYPLVARALPNAAHHALAALERGGYLAALVTQNVDGLHQRSGSKAVIELHGSLDTATCRGCSAVQSRATLQRDLELENPAFVSVTGRSSADGDAEIDVDARGFRAPDCPVCGGVLKPDVVFFGEGVPAPRVLRARAALAAADALLVIGSSLMVWSGYRFCEWAHAAGKPIAAINPGATRAERLYALKIDECCQPVLTGLIVELLATGGLGPDREFCATTGPGSRQCEETASRAPGFAGIVERDAQPAKKPRAAVGERAIGRQ